MLYKPILLYLAFMLIFGITLNAQSMTYSWPILPLGSEGKVVISGFCAFRPFYYQDGMPTESHFHGGIDIPEGTHAEAAVYTISLSFKVINIGWCNGVKSKHFTLTS